MSRLFDLDAMVAAARELCTALLGGSEPYGCFRWKDQPLPNLLYLNDVVMLCWVIDDLPADPELRSRWAATLNRFQDPEALQGRPGGAYRYPPFEPASWQHATVNTVIALNMLGARPRARLTMLEPLRDIETCRRWVAAHAEQHAAIPHHRYGLGAVVLNSRPPPPPGWADAFLTAVRDLQDPASGMFPNAAGRIDISATFMFSKILLNAGRELPRPDLMFDALLAAQRSDGTFTDRDTLGYHDMDAAFLLAHVAERRSYRRADARAALRRLADRVGEVWQRHGTFPGDPHQALAILSLAGVLKRALAPQNPPSSRAARFAPSQAAPGLRRNCRWRGKSDRLLGNEVAGNAGCRFHFTEPSLLRAS